MHVVSGRFPAARKSGFAVSYWQHFKCDSVASPEVKQQKGCDDDISGTSDMLCTCALPTDPGQATPFANICPKIT